MWNVKEQFSRFRFGVSPVRTRTREDGLIALERWVSKDNTTGKGGAQDTEKVLGHVDCSKGSESFNKSCDHTREKVTHLICSEDLGHNNITKSLGPDILAQCISKSINEISAESKIDILNEEIEANESLPPQETQTPILLKAITPKETEREAEERDNGEFQSDLSKDKEPMSIISVDCFTATENQEEGNMHMREMGEVNGLAIEEAVPLSTHVHVEETDPDFDTPIWVHQNIIRLSKEFGLDFKGSS